MEYMITRMLGMYSMMLLYIIMNLFMESVSVISRHPYFVGNTYLSH